MGEGYEKVCRFGGYHNLSGEERQEDDFYATSPMAAEWLIKIEDMHDYILGASLWTGAPCQGI